MARLRLAGLAFLCFAPLPGCAKAEEKSFSPADAARLNADLDRRIEDLSVQIERRPDDLRLRSERGDAHFFRGRFKEAVADYSTMIRIDPEQERGHWRRGIALYYAGDWHEAARQFSAYHAFDKVDRENGIWRFLAQAREIGPEKARAGLLDYDQPDRPPLGELYRMFAGQRAPAPADIMAAIAAADLSAAERTKQLFYAELYVGLYHASLDENEEARLHLRAAVNNAWGRRAQGGPGYMWHVARVHADLLEPRKNGKRGLPIPARNAEQR